MQTRNYILIGPMGAGKSTIGRLLAKELALPFKDSDKEIEERTGASIPLIFDVEGEAGFRDREQAVIAELCGQQGLVLATGGGAVLRAENRQAMRQGAVVIYLHASVEHQLARTARDRNRPLLQTENPKQRLHELLACREPLYAAVAHMTFETGKLPIYQTTRRLYEQLLECGFIATIKPLEG